MTTAGEERLRTQLRRLRRRHNRQSARDGIPTELYKQIRATLVQCMPRTEQELYNILVVTPLYQYRAHLPTAATHAGRVEQIINTLYNKTTANHQNALVILLEHLASLANPDDLCHHKLRTLAQQLHRTT